MSVPQHFICPSCHTGRVLYEPATVVSYVCGSCNAILYNSQFGFVKKGNLRPLKANQQLIPLGTTGELEGKAYTVITFAERFEAGQPWHWVEYTLRREEDGVHVFLSAYNNHWLLMAPIDNKGLFREADLRNAKTVNYQGSTLQQFHRYKAKYNHVSGEFNWNVSFDTSVNCIEFINPPYIMAVEYDLPDIDVFYGHYILRKAVNKAFLKGAAMPARRGIGVAQPFYFGIEPRRFLIGTLVFCILALFIQWSYNAGRAQLPVFSDHFVIDSGTTGIARVSKSFTLPDRMSNMEVEMSSDVNNNWAEADLDLVNEQTGKEVDFAIGTEFYAGVDEGESWSEGSLRQTAFLCSVAPGTYHFVLTPTKEASGPPVSIVLQVNWDIPSGWNAAFLCVVLALIAGGVYAGHYYFELKRGE